jgi:hypothetical protein
VTWKQLLRASVFCGFLAVGLWSGAAEATLPPGYDPAGTVLLNPAHVGTVGSQFTQDCTGVP